MARGLRHEDPRCGREHFDARAGVDWECGPDPNDVSGSIPDEPWPDYCRKRNAPRMLFSIGEWRVTSFGLELLSSVRERFERYTIPADRLLDLHQVRRVYKWPIWIANEPWGDLDTFEQALKVAIHIHCQVPRPVPVTLEQAVRMYFAEKHARGKPRPSLADVDLLDKTFRQARGIARRRANDKRMKRNLPPRLPNVRGAIIVIVERIMNGPTDIWLRCRSPKGYPAVLAPRPADENDVRVLTAAYPTFFSPWFDGPQEVYCAARWQKNDWFLLASEQPRAA